MCSRLISMVLMIFIYLPDNPAPKHIHTPPPQVRDSLLEMNSFLSSHNKEVVFLDFNHHYAMGPEHHSYLISMLQEVFGSKLCGSTPVDHITLDFLWARKYQITLGQGLWGSKYNLGGPP